MAEDFLSALRSDAIAAGHAGSAAPTPAADAQPSTGSTPAEPDAPAPVSGSTPEATAAPAQPTEGSTPPPSQVPAPPQTVDPDAQRYLEMYGGDVNRALKEALLTSNRAAELARQLKDRGAQPHADPAAVPQAAQPPAAPQAPPPAPAPEALERPEQATWRLANDDRECKVLIAQFNDLHTQIAATEKTEIPALQREILKQEALLQSEFLDEFAKEKTAAILQEKRVALAMVRLENNERQLRAQALDGAYQQRYGQIGAWVSQNYAARTREADQQQALEGHAARFKEAWEPAFERALTDNNVDPEMRADVLEAVKARALAQPGPIGDVHEFLRTAVKAEVGKLERYDRIQGRIHAKRKLAETPPPPTAVAATPPAPDQPADPDREMRLMMRAAVAARAR